MNQSNSLEGVDRVQLKLSMRTYGMLLNLISKAFAIQEKFYLLDWGSCPTVVHCAWVRYGLNAAGNGYLIACCKRSPALLLIFLKP